MDLDYFRLFRSNALIALGFLKVIRIETRRLGKNQIRDRRKYFGPKLFLRNFLRTFLSF